MDYSPLVTLHIGGGALSLIAGATAIFARKGARLHRAAGNIFFVTMLTMSASGGYLAYVKVEGASVIAGALTFYMVATAWMTVMRGENKVGLFDDAALLVAAATAAAGFTWGFEAAASESGNKDGFPAAIYLFFGFVATLAAILDLRVIARRGVSGRQRIARHLWRMGYGLFTAAASFFLGQSQIIPEPLREIQYLAAPVILTLVLMFFWLFRVLLTRWYENA